MIYLRRLCYPLRKLVQLTICLPKLLTVERREEERGGTKVSRRRDMGANRELRMQYKTQFHVGHFPKSEPVS